jgi:large subunit ribosomal protein L13
MKTTVAKTGQVERKWYVVDATDVALGRLSTRIATILMGKHKPIYTPHVDTGDFVVVVNADKVKLTGKKREQKTYQRYSGYPGGQTVIPFEVMQEKHPKHVIEHAVKGMLPKSRLGRQMYSKLKVHAGPEHTHEAQNPEPLEIKG